MAIGYKLVNCRPKQRQIKFVLEANSSSKALPFFSDTSFRDLGPVNHDEPVFDNTDLPYIRLYRVIIPPSTSNPFTAKGIGLRGPYRNMALNGCAHRYSIPPLLVAPQTG